MSHSNHLENQSKSPQLYKAILLVTFPTYNDSNLFTSLDTECLQLKLIKSSLQMHRIVNYEMHGSEIYSKKLVKQSINEYLKRITQSSQKDPIPHHEGAWECRYPTRIHSISPDDSASPPIFTASVQHPRGPFTEAWTDKLRHSTYPVYHVVADGPMVRGQLLANYIILNL